MIHNGFKSARPLARLRAGRTDWYRIENKSDGPTEIYIYDEIGYVGVSAQDFIKDLRAVKDSRIILHLDTPGGDVYDGINIFNAIQDHPAHVTVVVDAMAASAGSFILQAGDTRIMNRNSEVMIHEGHTIAMIDADEALTYHERLNQVSNNIASIYMNRAGGTLEEWRARMKKETWYSAQEAVNAGLADEMIVSTEKVANDFDLSIFSYAGRDKAPAPVNAEPEIDPSEGIDWNAIADALKGALA
jgi:ATP-dependent protease ClpP protease subunit